MEASSTEEPGDGVQAVEEGDPRPEVSEEVRHRLEVRIDEAVEEPSYDTPGSQKAQQDEAQHGSQGSQVGPADAPSGPTSGGQRPVPVELDVNSQAAVAESADMPLDRGRQVSPEQRREDVGQISRSLQYMTGLLTSLVTRVDRVEQRQSVSGSMAPQSTDEGSQPTPSAATPQGQLSWSEMDRLGGRMTALALHDASGERDLEHPPGFAWRPLAPMSRMLEGTFSSDSSGTARRRLEEAQRGVPGALLGPLAAVNVPLALDGLPIGEEWSGPMEAERWPRSAQQASELSSMSRPQQASELSSMSRPQQASELSSMSRPQQASELSSMSRPQQASELFRMSRPQQASELSSMSRPQQACELSSMSRPQQASELSSMSRPQQASELPSMSRSQQASGLSSMTRPIPTSESHSTARVPQGVGSLSMSGVPTQVQSYSPAGESLGWLYDAAGNAGESPGDIHPGGPQAGGSPVSVSAIQPPVEPSVGFAARGSTGVPSMGRVVVPLHRRILRQPLRPRR